MGEYTDRISQENKNINRIALFKISFPGKLLVYLFIVLCLLLAMNMAYILLYKNPKLSLINKNKLDEKIDYNYLDKYFLYENEEISFEYSNKLTLTNSKSTPENYLFNLIKTCDTDILYDKNNPVFFITINSGQRNSMGASPCRGDRPFPVTFKNVDDAIIEGGKNQDFGRIAEQKEIIYVVEGNQNKRSKLYLEEYTFNPDFDDNNLYRFSLVHDGQNKNILTPMFKKILESFNFKNKYRNEAPDEMKFLNFKSEILPIEFNYPNNWGKFFEHTKDVSYFDEFKAESYSLTFDNFKHVNDFNREAYAVGQSKTHAPSRGIYYADFIGYPSLPEGVYFKLGAALTNCEGDLAKLRSGDTPFDIMYIIFNLPNNPRINGVRLFLPMMSPYMNRESFSQIEAHCQLMELNNLMDTTAVNNLIEHLDKLKQYADLETQNNIEITKIIIKSAKIIEN